MGSVIRLPRSVVSGRFRRRVGPRRASHRAAHAGRHLAMGRQRRRRAPPAEARRRAARDQLAALLAQHRLLGVGAQPGESVARCDSAAGPTSPRSARCMQRLGGLLSNADEISGALRAGELVVVSAHGTRDPRHAGPVDPALIGTAVVSGAPVYPVASMSTPFGRTARVEVGSAVRPRRKRRGPLAELELAELTQRQHPTDDRRSRRSAHGRRSDRLVGGGLMPYARADDGARHPLRGVRSPRLAGGADDSGPRRRQARLGHAALQLGASLPSDRLRQSRCGPQRQAVRCLLHRADGRRRRRRARPRRRCLQHTSSGRRWAARSAK